MPPFFHNYIYLHPITPRLSLKPQRLYYLQIPMFDLVRTTSTMFDQHRTASNDTSSPPSNVITDTHPAYIQTKKKYKPVALKVQPVIMDLPNRFRIVQNIIENPLKDMPKLNP